MNILRVLAQVLFCGCAILFLFMSAWGLVLCIAWTYVFIERGQMLSPASHLAVGLLLASAGFLSSLYILMGRHKWHALISIGALGLIITLCLQLLVAAAFDISSPWSRPESQAATWIGSYCLFLLMGVLLRYHGYWDRQTFSDVTPVRIKG